MFEEQFEQNEDHVGPPGPKKNDRAQRESIGNPLNMSFSWSNIEQARKKREETARPSSAGPPMMPTLTRQPLTASKSSLSFSNRQPSWITHDREVLRFYTYFEEPITEYGFKSSIKKSMRTRKCTLLYYLADNTIAIDEPKTKNSGLVQGRFMKRTRVAHPSHGAIYQPSDFFIGAEMVVFGRTFHVVDADPKTRQYFRNVVQQDLDQEIPYPDDGFDTSRRRLETTYLEREDEPASGNMTLLRASSKDSLRTELVDSKVLRFFCAYEDDRLQGEQRKYTLHYFMSDETIEIKEERTEGTHPFPYLLRRCVMPRDALRMADNPLVEPVEKTRITWEDLACGEVLNVYNRPLLLLSCDPSTERWYESKGISQRPLQLAPDEGNNVPRPLPPYNGFGAEDDLYAMGLSLQPKTASSQQEDYQRFMAADNKVLRFTCSLVGCSDEDAIRRFVINYYLADDTISVYEPPIRNSGMSGGSFLVRTRYKKFIPTQGRAPPRGSIRPRGGVLSRWLRPADFRPDAVVTFEMPNSGSVLHTFKIESADGYTLKVLHTKDKDDAPDAGVALLLVRLAEKFCAGRIQARYELERADKSNSRVLSERVFKQIVRDMESRASGNYRPTKLTEAELDEVVAEFAARPEDYGEGDDEFEASRTAFGYGGDVCQKPHLDEDGGIMVHYCDFVDSLGLASPAPKLPDNGVRSQKKPLEKMMLKLLKHQFSKGDGGGENSSNGSRLRASFRAHDRRGGGLVPASAWFAVLRDHKFHGLLTRQNAEELRQRYSQADEAGGGLDYGALCDAVFPGNFRDFMEGLMLELVEPGASSMSLSGNEIRGHRRVSTIGTQASNISEAAMARAKDASTIAEHAQQAKKRAPTTVCGAPTVTAALREVNETNRTQFGEVPRQLKAAMQAFSSAFGRNHRRKMLRKHFMAFDVANTGSVNKEEYDASLMRIINEGFCDFDPRDRQLLSDFLFPTDQTRHNYDQLQGILVARDVHGLVRMHNEATSRPDDPKLAFDASKIDAPDAYGESGAHQTLP